MIMKKIKEKAIKINHHKRNYLNNIIQKILNHLSNKIIRNKVYLRKINNLELINKSKMRKMNLSYQFLIHQNKIKKVIEKLIFLNSFKMKKICQMIKIL